MFSDNSRTCRSEVNELPDNLLNLFDQVLARIEADFSQYPSLVQDCLSYIHCGRFGLAAEELQALLKDHAPRLDPKVDADKLPNLLWSHLYRALSAFLFERGGTMDFFHEQMRATIERRYFQDGQYYRQVHKKIADYFEIRWDEPYMRALDELPYQRTKANDWDGVERILCNLEFVEAKCVNKMVYELVRDYVEAEQAWPGEQQVRYEELERQHQITDYLEKLTKNRYSSPVRDSAAAPVEGRLFSPQKHEAQGEWTPLEKIRAWSTSLPTITRH